MRQPRITPAAVLALVSVSVAFGQPQAELVLHFVEIGPVVVTHPHADHYNYWPDVLTDDITVGQVLLVEGNYQYEVPSGDFDGGGGVSPRRWICCCAVRWTRLSGSLQHGVGLEKLTQVSVRYLLVQCLTKVPYGSLPSLIP